jgi:hypothetical protein
MLVIMKMLADYSRVMNSDPHRWKDLSNEQKQQVIAFGITLGIFMTYVIGSKIGDDDDDKKYSALHERTRRLFMEDATQGMNPLDIARTATTPIATVSKLFRTGNAMWDFMTEGLWGARTMEGKPKGLTELYKAIPVTSTLAEIDRYFKPSVKEGSNRIMYGYWTDPGTRSVDARN